MIHQGWGLDCWTRSLRELVLLHLPLLSFKFKRTGSDGYPYKGHALLPLLDKILLRHSKRYRQEAP